VDVEPCEVFREVEGEDEKNLLTGAILEKEGEVQGKTGHRNYKENRNTSRRDVVVG